jgi:hypothetical protein
MIPKPTNFKGLRVGLTETGNKILIYRVIQEESALLWEIIV